MPLHNHHPHYYVKPKVTIYMPTYNNLQCLFLPLSQKLILYWHPEHPSESLALNFGLLKHDGLAKTSRSHFEVRQIVTPILIDPGSICCES